MKQVIIFTSNDRGSTAYNDVERYANDWLKKNPDAIILASHTNMVATEDWSEFSLTLIVEQSESEPTKPSMDTDQLREHVYSAESQVQRAIDALEPIHHDSTLRQVMIDLGTAMDAILEIREMLPEE